MGFSENGFHVAIDAGWEGGDERGTVTAISKHFNIFRIRKFIKSFREMTSGPM